MNRDTRRGEKQKNTGMKKIIYISGSVIAIAVIAFVIIFIMYGNKVTQETKIGKSASEKINSSYNQVLNKESVTDANSKMGKTINEVEEQEGNTTKNEMNTTTNTTTEKRAVNTSATEAKVQQEKEETKKKEEQKKVEEEKKKEDPVFSKPVEGEILTGYAKENLVYSNTLAEWVTHNGIDIKADKTTVVKAAEQGTIKSIKNDPRYGLTVVIEHNNGFKSVYANLLTAEFVTVGEKVEKGQTIGTVGNTATFEIADDFHLHFEIWKDDVVVDPEMYLK